MRHGGGPDGVTRYSHTVDVRHDCSVVFREDAFLKVETVLRGKSSEEVCHRVLGEEFLVGSYM